MNMSKDITGLLHEWDYDEEDTVRLVVADDGRQVMQVRLPLGIEQYELDGRPDGVQPFGKETVLEEMQDRLDDHLTAGLEEHEYEVDSNELKLLQKEGLLFYYRYLLLFQIGDYERTIRDSGHNLMLCAFVEKYCRKEEEKNQLLQYKPYIVRVNALSRAMVSLNQDQHGDAQQVLENAIELISSMREVDTPVFQYERIRSLSHLKETLSDVKEKHSSPVDKLRDELDRAVEEENYERAAELRDEISTFLRRET